MLYEEVIKMIEVINALLSYLLLVLVVVAVGGLAIYLGILLRKWRDTKAAKTNEAVSNEEPALEE